MAKTHLKNQIIEWLKGKAYWLQYSGNRILEGEINDEELIERTYKYFKEDLRLSEIQYKRVEVVFNEIPQNEEIISDEVNLLSIYNIENVNALSKGQRINIKKNLTLIYGNNGTGKSGYIRLLNNTFISRGDKSLLTNVFNKDEVGNPKCNFTFRFKEKDYDKSFPKDNGCYEFSMFSVFDTQSVKVHLDNDNQLNFTPSGFEFFENLLELFGKLRMKLTNEINDNQPENNFIFHFKNENPIKKIVASLNEYTNIDEVKKSAEFTKEDEIELKKINTKITELKALNIQVQISGLEKLKRELTDFSNREQAILDVLTEEKITYYKKLIEKFHKLKALSKEQGEKSLESYDIELIGSEQWRSFIIAASNYSNLVIAEKGADYPKKGDNCLFCLRPLEDEQLELISTYWKFIRSEAERELNRVINEIRSVEKSIKGLSPIVFNDTTNLYSYLNEINPQLVEKWNKIIKKSEQSRINLIQNFDSFNNQHEISSFIENTIDFKHIILNIEKEIKSLFLKKPDQEIATLTFTSNILTDKMLLNGLLPKIIKHLKKHKWAKVASDRLTSLRTNSITTFQGELFSNHINEKYTEIFNSECIKLEAPQVVNIVQRNSKVRTFRKLQIAKETVSSILSEGEQRAISLADFITEALLNPNNRGLIFDDPVTSLDHQRRDTIAKRLVVLSKLKQVIIFTHDISFLSKLQLYASKESEIDVDTTTIRKIGNQVGIIKPDLPWIAQKITARIKYLRNHLVDLNRLEKSGEEDKYNIQIRGWYGLLREAWERSIEERLFKGAIERFSGEIHTKPIKRIEITKEMISMIDEGMTQSSNWVHDQAMGLNPPIPNCEKAEKDLELLNAFSELCKAQ